MTLETLLVWIVVGLVAGFLASLVVGGVGGILADIAVGIAGAFIGGWIFNAVGAGQPGGLGGSIVVAFVGAVVLLLIVHGVRRMSAGARTTRRREV